MCFITRLRNLNYGKPMEVPGDVGANVGVNAGANVGVKLTKSETALLEMLNENGTLTAAELAAKLSVDIRTAERGLKKLRDNNIIERVGSDKAGSWVVK